MYRYLYEDFTGNIIDDLYLVKYNTTDYRNNVVEFEEAVQEVYKKLEDKYFWKSLKN